MAGLLSVALALAACRGGSSSAGAATDGGTAGTDGQATEDPDTESASDTDTPIPEGFEPSAGGMRKLVGREYVASVRLLLGSAAANAATPPGDVSQDGFDAVAASIVPLASTAIEDYERSGAAVADAVVANPADLIEQVPCVGGSDSSCYAELAATLGRLAYRRSLTADEIDTLAAIGEAGRAWDEGAFMTGIRYELLAILQAPSFIYIQEVGEEDPNTGFRKLKPTELATRMAFFLTGHTPSGELLDLAESGMLETAQQVRAQAEQMVASSDARPALGAFFDEALRLRNLSLAPKDSKIFPAFSPELGDYMRDETLLLLYDIVWERDADFRELFNAPYTFVNDPLAELYNIPAPGQGPVFSQVDWPSNQNRAGYTSQGSFLTWQSGPLRNSPTRRGKYVQEMILCTDIPPPDPSVDPTLPDLENVTLRELLEAHMDQPGCATCHGLTDPIGFAFEGFTAIGQFRTTEAGAPVDASGSVPGLGDWQNAREFGDALAQDPRVSACLIRNMMRGMLGQSPENAQEPGIEDLDATFADAGFRVQSLMVDMTAHALFRLVDEPK